MTENMQIAISAINKWVYYSLNYDVAPYTKQNSNKIIYVPSFILEIKWTCPLCHMIDKWESATKSNDSRTYLINFYIELDSSNSILMLEWIMNHYNDEIKLKD